MAELLIGYARVSTDGQDLTAQREAPAALGVAPTRIYVDHGLTGTTRDRPGLREALAACRTGDTLVVTKLDRPARSLPDARAIADELTARQVKLNLGGAVYDPRDPVGRLLFNVLALVAEFEADLIRMRTREGMKVAKAKGKLRGKQPKLSCWKRASAALFTGCPDPPSGHSGQCACGAVRVATGVSLVPPRGAIDQYRVPSRLPRDRPSPQALDQRQNSRSLSRRGSRADAGPLPRSRLTRRPMMWTGPP